MKRAILFSLVVAPLLAAQTTQPQPSPSAAPNDPFARSREAAREQLRKRLESLPDAGEFDRAKLLRITVRNGFLHVDWLGPAGEMKTQNFNVPGGAPIPHVVNIPAQKRITLTGVPGLAYMTGAPISGNSRILSHLGWINFHAANGELSQAQIAFSSRSGDEAIMISGGYSGDSPFQNAMLVQNRFRGVTSIRLMLPTQFANNHPVRRQSVNAQNIFDLRDKYPLEVRKYVIAPIVQLTGKNPVQPSALEINKLFPKLKAPTEAIDKVRKALELCDSDEAIQRAKGARDLLALGDEGALAASQLPLDSLSVEQRSTVDFFLSTFSSGASSPQRPREALLIDCLESDDPEVKRLAAQALHVDPNTPPDELRLKLLPRPATQPTNDPNEWALPSALDRINRQR